MKSKGTSSLFPSKMITMPDKPQTKTTARQQTGHNKHVYSFTATGDKDLQTAESTLFDIQSVNFTYKLLSKQLFVKQKKKKKKKKKIDDKCRPKSGTERVKAILFSKSVDRNSCYRWQLGPLFCFIIIVFYRDASLTRYR